MSTGMSGAACAEAANVAPRAIAMITGHFISDSPLRTEIAMHAGAIAKPMSRLRAELRMNAQGVISHPDKLKRKTGFLPSPTRTALADKNGVARLPATAFMLKGAHVVPLHTDPANYRPGSRLILSARAGIAPVR
jgi:hypothetical protein